MKKLWLLLLSGLFFLPTSNIAQEKESSFSTVFERIVAAAEGAAHSPGRREAGEEVASASGTKGSQNNNLLI